MRRRTCLARLNGSLARRVFQLEFVASQVSGKSGHEIDQTLAFLMIEALTVWSNFVREFYLSCAYLYPKTIGGQHVSHLNATVVNEREALIHSIFVLKGRVFNAARISPFDEPTWREKRTLSALSQNMNLSNNAAIVAGLSYQTSFFDEAHTVRNFYAHRSRGTADRVSLLAARNYGLVALPHPNELINVVLVGRTQTLVQEWLGDIRNMCSLMCQ